MNADPQSIGSFADLGMYPKTEDSPFAAEKYMAWCHLDGAFFYSRNSSVTYGKFITRRGDSPLG